jgi:hypothetical protein
MQFQTFWNNHEFSCTLKCRAMARGYRHPKQWEKEVIGKAGAATRGCEKVFAN